MTLTASEYFMLTPAGVLHAFAHPTPDQTASALQTLLTGERSLNLAAWTAADPLAPSVLAGALDSGWVQVLHSSLQGPDARLDDFLQHVIASLSGERRAVLASEEGFCLGRTGVDQDEAEIVCAAAADYSGFAARQARRGWDGGTRYVSFHRDPEFLLPDHVFMPFWVDGAGYWLILMGEPLLNNPALVELLWGIKQAGTRFATIG
ncbi:hypothetical protein [Polaromonas naphthalenivorans]|uniref:Uncharacterized protein n=1 Tax=Polaromonas naphthalenivorans (strain CJ2) TaxID=365044 RepID=A1VR32_POLNA|nr:hypothetical protein [Polaromonas naphthalenivorans]ABM38110.1 hypothetical protein Pnap_2808 [Polaromonas naphthalenivorans CJ2]